MQTTFSNARRSVRRQMDTLSRLLFFALALLLGLASLAAHAVNESDLLSPEQAFPLTVSVSGPKQVTLDFNTKPGYYLYRDRFSFAVDGAPAKPDSMPTAETKNDPTFGMVQVYHRPVQIRISLPAPITSSVVLTVTSQGCADLGVCYPPQTRSYRVTADGSVTSVATGNSTTAGVAGFPDSGDPQPSARPGINLHPANGISTGELLGFLFAGVLMAGTVCMRCLQTSAPVC